MTAEMLSSRDLDFLLYEFLDTESLVNRPRYQEHSREIFDVTISGAKKIADRYFANHYSKGDSNEPNFDGENVQLVPETQDAWDAVAEYGMMAAHHDFSDGGMQLPEVVCRAAGAYFSAANVSSSGYYVLTVAAANLISSFGSEEQKERYMRPMMDGSFAGTMALTEPEQGSALADITTKARPKPDGNYLIKGQKIFITNGDHDLTDNIIHLVLARIEGAPAGVNGISLFVVPKIILNDDGTLGERNDVALAGLLHKMGCRNATSTMLSFGENEGAVGYLLGQPHQGLTYMFQMMNDMRVGVGLGAAVLAYRAYLYSLDYARERRQGRLPSNKDPLSKQTRIIEHADVRRMLLTQKMYSEGSLALCLYAASLVEDSQTASTDGDKQRAAALLDLLTPIVKSWPSKYGCVSNDLAIQVLGGSGYIREHPVEQLYRDQRLNPIHEGTEGIHGLDLLGRKVRINNQYNYLCFKDEVRKTLTSASESEGLAKYVSPVEQALKRLDEVTDCLLAVIQENPDRGLANATVYLDMFGRIVMAWIWLKQAVVATQQLQADESNLAESERNFYKGKIHATQYCIEWELPQTVHQTELLMANNTTCFEMQDDYF